MGNLPAFRIAQKELKDLLRDKRSLLISLVFPLVFFPLAFGALEGNLKDAKSSPLKTVTVALASGRSHPAISFLRQQGNMKVIESDSPVTSLEKREVLAALSIQEITGKQPSGNKNSEITLTFDNSRQSSIIAAAMIEEVLAFYRKSTALKKEESEEKRLLINKKMLMPPARGESILTLSLILPLLLLTFTAISTAAVAADTGAGEKERQTIEPLLTNPVSRIDILTGKFLATTIMGMAGVASFIAGFAISYLINPGFLGTAGFELAISAKPLALICTQTILLSMIFGSAELSLSIFAKSTKEAQILFIPLLMASMACGYSTTMIDPGVSVSPLLRHIPLVNISLLIKELTLGMAAVSGVITTFAWSLFYILACFGVSLAFFSSEKAVFRN